MPERKKDSDSESSDDDPRPESPTTRAAKALALLNGRPDEALAVAIPESEVDTSDIGFIAE